MIHDEIVGYDVAKLAKENGFPIECDLFYNRNGDLCDERNYDSFDNEIWCFAPTQSLLQRWLREEKKIYVCPCIISDYEDDYTPHIVYWSFIIVNTESGDSIYREYERVDEKRFDTYELALEDALKYALENLV